MKSNTTTKSLGTRMSPQRAVQNLQSLNEHAMTIGQQRSMSAKSVCSFKEARPSKPRLSKTDPVQNFIGRSVSFDVTNKHCLYFFGPIQDCLKAASYPGLKKGCFPSDTVPNGYLKGTLMNRDKSSNVTSWEVAWNYTAFGNLKVFHPQAVEYLDRSDDESNFSETSESFVPPVASKDSSSCLEGSHKLGESPTRDDINLIAAIKANYRWYLVNDPTASKDVPPPARGMSHLATHPGTITIALG
jgi:hypothetical protein